MEEELYTALLSKKRFNELLDKMGIVEPEKREAEWKALKEFCLFEVLKLVVGDLPEAEKQKLGEGLDSEKEADRKKYYQRVNEYILAKKLSREAMLGVLKKAVEAAYNDYADKIKQK